MRQYIDLLRAKDVRRLSPSPELMINIHSVTANFGIDQPLLSAALIGLVALLVGLAAWHAPLWRFWSASLIGSILVGPHIFGYDGAVLLLPIWLVMFRSESRVARLIATFLAAPLVFFCSVLDSPWPMIPSLALLAWLGALAWENQTGLKGRVSEEAAAALEEGYPAHRSREPFPLGADL